MGRGGNQDSGYSFELEPGHAPTNSQGHSGLLLGVLRYQHIQPPLYSLRQKIQSKKPWMALASTRDIWAE